MLCGQVQTEIFSLKAVGTTVCHSSTDKTPSFSHQIPSTPPRILSVEAGNKRDPAGHSEHPHPTPRQRGGNSDHSKGHSPPRGAATCPAHAPPAASRTPGHLPDSSRSSPTISPRGVPVFPIPAHDHDSLSPPSAFPGTSRCSPSKTSSCHHFRAPLPGCLPAPSHPQHTLPSLCLSLPCIPLPPQRPSDPS